MDETTLRALDHNVAAANQAYLGTSELGDAAENRDAWSWCCGLPAADFNVVFPKLPVRDLGACIDRGAALFEARGLPWRLLLRDSHAAAHAAALSAAGFAEAVRFPGMVLDPAAELPPAPAGLELREAKDAEDLDRFCRTAFRGFGLPEELGAKFVTAGFLERPRVALCLGFREGEPVCTAATVATGEWIGIYWVATPEPHRGRGFGEAATWAAIAAGRRLGGRRAFLTASALGRPVYERMGFEVCAEYVHFERAGPG